MLVLYSFQDWFIGHVAVKCNRPKTAQRGHISPCNPTFSKGPFLQPTQEFLAPNTKTPCAAGVVRRCD